MPLFMVPKSQSRTDDPRECYLTDGRLLYHRAELNLIAVQINQHAQKMQGLDVMPSPPLCNPDGVQMAGQNGDTSGRHHNGQTGNKSLIKTRLFSVTYADESQDESDRMGRGREPPDDVPHERMTTFCLWRLLCSRVCPPVH